MRHENRDKIVQIYEVMGRKIRSGNILYVFAQLFATSVHFLFEKFAAMTLVYLLGFKTCPNKGIHCRGAEICAFTME